MARNILTVTKWLPLEGEENLNLFIGCKQLETSSMKLVANIGDFLRDYQNQYSHNIHKSTSVPHEYSPLTEKLELITQDVEDVVKGFNEAFSKLHLFRPPVAAVKALYWKELLWKTKLKVSYLLQTLVRELLSLFVYCGNNFLVLIFRISNMYNECLLMDERHGLSKGISICGNMCPYLLYPLRKISITKLLQILSQNRAETCCHKLIDCLLDIYKLCDTSEEENASDNSSIEIYKAIAKHMSPPQEVQQSSKQKSEEEKDEDNFKTIKELICCEEDNVLQILNVAIEISPSMLGKDGIKKSKYSNEAKLSSKAKNKVLGYYQQILWGEVGNFLEHIILWWGTSPLSARAPHSSQHLREWINQLVPKSDLPTFILAALTNLADALGVHVVSTSWDQQFRLALVASKATYTHETGLFFSDMLNNLVSLCNQCEVTSDWILGAPLEELPLIEQIPILHRLDHSIHTTRLWSVNETKRLGNNWNMEKFFTITHCDIVNCLAQLSELRLADHSLEIEKGGLGVHVQVCAKMREKLVSEVKENHAKLKDTPQQCIENLSKICRIVSLANLQMIFPKNKFWKQRGYKMPEEANPYVDKYLNEILSPVLAATEDHHVSNMVLRIMCECLLDHIYVNKVKFSHYGAYQLLTDFASIRTWITNCPIITQEIRKKMLKNEVLKRCEGVGRLLLRSPGEKINMEDKFQKMEDNCSQKSDNTQLMPAEMYVPNQQQWLTLRARHRKPIFNISTCCKATE